MLLQIPAVLLIRDSLVFGTDPVSDPALFVIDLQDANKQQIFS
jgi:hypothetical protein